MLGFEIRVIQPFGFFKHVFAEKALEHAGRGNRTKQMEMLGTNRFSEFHCIARTLDIYLELDVSISRKIIDRCQMEKVRGLFSQFFAVDRNNSKFRLGQVTHNWNGALGVAFPIVVQAGECILLARTHQKVNNAVVAFQQLFDKPTPDKARCTRNEILHKRLLIVF